MECPNRGLPTNKPRSAHSRSASALTARKAMSDLAMLSLDGRVRKAADRLGFALLPSDAELAL